MTTNVQSLLASMQAIDKTKLTEDERTALRKAAGELQVKTETTWETIQRIVWVDTCTMGSMRALVDLDLFAKWAAAGGGRRTAEELGKLTNADPNLLVRLLRHICCVGLASNPEPHKYEMNDFSASHADEVQKSAWRLLHDLMMPTYLGLPKWLGQHKYQNLVGGDPRDLAFNVGKMTTQSPWEHWLAHPQEFVDFSNCMKGYASCFGRWTDLYPSEKLLEGAGDEALVVDMGGSIGHDLMHFAEKHRVTQDKLILQDQPEVVKGAVSTTAFTIQTHDFFKPQPVKGARAYFMHSVLHDWPDDDAVRILSNIKEALGPQSRVLVQEFVLKNQGPSVMAAQSDVLMMSLGKAVERTEDMWAAIAARAGYRIEHIYSKPLLEHSVIELQAAS